MRPLKVTVGLDRTEAATFDDFFCNTLGMGALPFDWTHPRTLADVTFRFVGGTPPHLQPEAGGVRWLATLTLEIMP